MPAATVLQRCVCTSRLTTLCFQGFAPQYILLSNCIAGTHAVKLLWHMLGALCRAGAIAVLQPPFTLEIFNCTFTNNTAVPATGDYHSDYDYDLVSHQGAPKPCERLPRVMLNGGW